LSFKIFKDKKMYNIFKSIELKWFKRLNKQNERIEDLKKNIMVFGVTKLVVIR